MINIEDFDKDVGIYYIGIHQKLKKNDDYENIYSVNPVYLNIGEVDGHTEEKNRSKYLTFDPTDENKEVLKK